MSDAVIYRVFTLPESLLTAMRKKRDEVETTNVRFLADVVDRHLPNLVEDWQRSVLLGHAASAEESTKAAILAGVAAALVQSR